MGIQIRGSDDSITPDDGTMTLNGISGLRVGTADYPAAGPLSNRNKIINGDMRIDQRNAGSSVTVSTSGFGYTVDRWGAIETTDGAMTAQQDTSAPASFVNSLKFTTTTADSSLGSSQFAYVAQRIEGTNVSDLGWGTANAKTVTISFWVRSSLTGTFGGSVYNNNANRSYPFTYTISAADTWEQKSVTIAGDTSGTWLTTTGVGLILVFGLGVSSGYSATAGSWVSALAFSATDATSVIGTNGATWYITGVQLEVGSVATPFEHRSYGDELARCQRYLGGIDTRGQAAFYHHFGVYTSDGSTSGMGNISFAVTMRQRPTKIYASAANKFWGYGCTGYTTINYDQGGINSGAVNLLGGTGGQAAGTAGRFLANNATDAYILFDAEL